MFHGKRIETIDRKDLGTFRNGRLRKIIGHTWERNLFYLTSIGDLGLTPEDIHSGIQVRKITTGGLLFCLPAKKNRANMLSVGQAG